MSIRAGYWLSRRCARTPPRSRRERPSPTCCQAIDSLGVVTREAAEMARSRDDHQLEPLVVTVPTVTEVTVLAKVYQLFGSGLPVAVVDGNGRLVVDRLIAITLFTLWVRLWDTGTD